MAVYHPPPPLDYAPPVPWQRRRVVRRVAGLGVLIVLGFAAWRWGPGAWWQAQTLYWQRQCLNHTLPADQVVYEHDPAGPPAASPPVSAAYTPLVVGDYAGRPTQLKAQAYVPRCASEVSARVFGGLQQAINRLSTGITRAGSSIEPVLFMHEMRTPAGGRRLVILRGSFTADDPPLFINGLDVNAVVLQPGTWREPPADRTGPVALSVMRSRLPAPKHLRVFAGQPDPADLAHFTIRYEWDGKPAVVDGWLKEGGSGYAGVLLKVRP